MLLSLQNIQHYMKLLEYLGNCVIYIWYAFIQYSTEHVGSQKRICGRICPCFTDLNQLQYGILYAPGIVTRIGTRFSGVWPKGSSCRVMTTSRLVVFSLSGLWRRVI